MTCTQQSLKSCILLVAIIDTMGRYHDVTAHEKINVEYNDTHMIEGSKSLRKPIFQFREKTIKLVANTSEIAIIPAINHDDVYDGIGTCLCLNVVLLIFLNVYRLFIM
ncbi:unnamed protein product [Dicrocoelium dendriticum]|nr:unnamed protein product [Dicrocoelium dendriticum]